MLNKFVNELMELEGSEDYDGAKQIFKDRKNLRDKLREGLNNEEELSNNSSNYAGLVKTNGRISWKGVADELAEKYKIDVEELNEILDEYRGKANRLAYGRIEDLKKRRGSRQLEFDFVTPGYLGDE